MESSEYFVYGVTIDPDMAEKFDIRYNVFVFDGRRILSEESWMRFFSTEELEFEQILRRFNGTSGVNGIVVEDVITKLDMA